jgi:hypothetical protein
VTKSEVIDAFVRGDLDRRGFVGRLGLLGVSAGAAGAYAVTLGGGSVLAAPGSGNGLARYMAAAQEEDYGTAFSFETEEEAITLVLDAISDVQSILAGLEDLTADDFDEGVYDILTTIATQQAEHADALAAILGTTPAESAAGSAPASAEELLTALADSLEALANLLAAVAPALGSGESRQTVTNIAIVVGGQLSIVRYLAGLDPLPDTFQEPAVP